jgi:hypothetical protein
VYGTVQEGPAVAFNTHQPEFGGGYLDTFLACFDAATGTLIWESYFGGEGEDHGGGPWGGGIEVVEDGLIYITGFTASATSISTIGTHQEALSNTFEFDAFLACFNQNGMLEWATYYGGNGSDTAISSAAIYGNALYVSGLTTSTQGIAFGNPLQPALQSNVGTYLAKFSRFNGTLMWATYTASTQAGGCLLTKFNVLANSKLLLNGQASPSCSGFATPNAWQTSYGGGDFEILYAIYTDNTLSTTNSPSTNILQVFPNPAQDVLYIHRSSAPANATYTVRDVSGKVLMQGLLNSTQSQINVGHLPSGMYLLRVTGLGSHKTVKFIKE